MEYSPKIPKIIHQIWLNEDAPPPIWLKTWRDAHPGWEYRLWTKNNMPQLLNQKQFDSVETIMKKTYALASEILYLYGGIYVNANSECVQPLQESLLKHSFFGCYENDIACPGIISYEIFGCELNHPITTRFLQKFYSANGFDFTSPYFTRIIRQYEIFNKKVKILPSHVFFPINPTGIPYTGKGKVYAIQHWPLEPTFSKIYHDNFWGSPETISGISATLEITSPFRDEIPPLLKSLNIHSLLDAPCGDFNWMKEIDLDVVDSYIGIDIVQEIISANRKLYENAKTHFYHCDLTHDPLPKCDLILCRDCLVHLSYKDIFAALKNFKKSGATYLLTTNIKGLENQDTAAGGWRPIDFQKPPFNFPPPLNSIDEKCIVYPGRFLSLWKLSDL